MMFRMLTYSMLVILLSACRSRDTKNETQIKEQLLGDWEQIIEEGEDSFTPHYFFTIPNGISFTKDSVELYTGIFKDPTNDKRKSNPYIGSFANYRISDDTIFITNPAKARWELKWKFIARKNDTLLLVTHDSTIIKFKKLNYNIDTLPDFDQVIYASSGCYGTCPVMSVSIDNHGKMMFDGLWYTTSLGRYMATLDANNRKYIFNKFRKANPLGLLDEYAAKHTDDQTLTTTFIKNGKIIKTIRDYGRATPKELVWAYIPIANLYQKVQLKNLQVDNPFQLAFGQFNNQKDGKSITLEQSEAFYLWTELQKAKLTIQKFQSVYDLLFMNDTYELDPEKTEQKAHVVKSIHTDGRFYQFNYFDGNSVTYDLGYNFIERNAQVMDSKPL